MDSYEKALALWQRKKIETEAELAEALSGFCSRTSIHLPMETDGRVESP